MSGTAPSRPGLAAGLYRRLWSVLARWFRVPATPPELPAVEGERSESFRPAPGFLSYLKLWFWLVTILVDTAILAAWIAAAAQRWWLGLLLLPPALALAVIPQLLGYVAIHLRYDSTWYVMSDRSLRIRRGIWLIHEMTITFENVQNVNVQQGPVQRFFGISSVLVETAGGGAERGRKQGLQIGNRGVIEGIADGDRRGQLIMNRLRASRSAGLGDEAPTAGEGWTAAHLALLREIRDGLRAAPAGRP